MAFQMLQPHTYCIDLLPVAGQLIFDDVVHLHRVFCQERKGLLFAGVVNGVHRACHQKIGQQQRQYENPCNSGRYFKLMLPHSGFSSEIHFYFTIFRLWGAPEISPPTLSR